MASPSSFSVSNSNGRFTLTLTLTESTNVSNNTSTVGYTLTLRANTSYHFQNYSIGRKITLNGSVVYNVSRAYSPGWTLNGNSSITIATGTTTIGHNADGTKNISVGYEIQMTSEDWTPGNLSGSGTSALTNIPRYAEITSKSATVISESSVRLDWTTDAICDYMWYSTNNGSSWTGYDMTDGKSGSKTVTGLTANTTYNFKIRVRRKDSQLNTDSSAISGKTYDIPKCTSYSDFLIGDGTFVTISNPLNRSVTVALVNTAHNVVYASTTTTGTTIMFSPDANTLYATIPNTKEGTFHVRVTCSAISSTDYNTTGAKYKVKESECQPTFGSNPLSYTDTNATTSSMAGTSIIQNKSTLRATVTAASALKSATIVSYKFWIGTTVYQRGSAGSVDFGTINASSNVKLYCEATDSRGFTVRCSKTVTIIPYTNPSAVVTLARVNNYEDNYTLTIKAKATNISGNTATLTYGRSGQTQTSTTFTGSKTVTSTGSLSKNNAYAFTVSVTDTIGGTAFSGTFYLPKGKFPFFIDTSKNSVGFNDFPNADNQLKSAMDCVLTGTLDVSGKTTLHCSLYDHSDDTSESSLNTWLDNIYDNMGNTRVTECTICCGGFGNSSYYSGDLRRISASSGVFIGYRNNGDKVIKSRVGGSWQNAVLIADNCWDKIYPVGAIYMSVDSTSPATLFGGTWSRLKDRFLLGAGDTYSSGATGGSANLQKHTHSIPALSGTAASAGAHTHTVKGLSGDRSGTGSCLESFGSEALATRNVTDAVVSAGAHTHNVTTTASTSGETGSGTGQNMPPYLVVYMWKRTA